MSDEEPTLDSLGDELAGLILRILLEEGDLSWQDAAGRVQEALHDLIAGHEDGVTLTDREEAKARAVAEGNDEGFGSDPEPIPDVFRDGAP